MTVLYCLSNYTSQLEKYKKGDVIEVSPEKAEFLLADSPGSFSTEKPKVEKALDKPPKDKAVKRAATTRKTTKATK